MRPVNHSKRNRLPALLFVLATLSRPHAVLAQQPTGLPTIVLVADHADSSIIATLVAELTALGMHALVVPAGDHEMTPGELTDAARQNHAIAAFRVLGEARRVEVWLADRVTGKVLLREVLMTRDSAQSATEESAVVARAVELLRARLLELDINERPSIAHTAPVNSAVKPKSPIVTTATSEKAARFGLATDFALLAASSHAAVSTGVAVALQWHASPRFALLARTTLPFNRVSYTAPQGRAELTARWASLGMRYSGPRSSHNWQASLESGIGLLLVDAVGVAQSGYLARSNFGLDPVIFVATDIRYFLSSRVAASIGITGGPGLHPSKILFDEQLIDRYGQWVMLSRMGLELTWH